jgi:cobaltochelatase CobN
MLPDFSPYFMWTTMESMALYLMGIEPVWNPRGVVNDLRLIPDAELGRPRVDVVFSISAIYRDGMSDKVLLLNRAARMAAAAGDNAISRHDREVAESLRKSSVDGEMAGKIARARVFGNKPGQYGVGLDKMVEQSKDAGNTQGLADVYFHYMSFAFSSEVWGQTAPKALESHLAGNEAVLFSRSTNLYGILDNDDTYQYVGGLNLATKVANHGAAPEFYIHNLRKPGSESLVDVKTWLANELNGRQWNPKWIVRYRKYIRPPLRTQRV